MTNTAIPCYTYHGIAAV